jgi:hypothetical protein
LIDGVLRTFKVALSFQWTGHGDLPFFSPFYSASWSLVGFIEYVSI